MKKILISILVFVAFCSVVFTFKTKNENLYPKTAQISKVDFENDLVYCVDGAGEVWAFSGVEDWEVGDICSMIMDNRGTQNIEDDKIVKCQYSGIF